ARRTRHHTARSQRLSWRRSSHKPLKLQSAEYSRTDSAFAISGVSLMAENSSFLCRRTFVTTALLGLAGCAAACSTTAHWYTPDTNSQADALEVPLSALGPENYVILDAKNFPAPILLARQEQNYTAVEMLCTHRGCAVHVQRNR